MRLAVLTPLPSVQSPTIADSTMSAISHRVARSLSVSAPTSSAT